MAYDPIAELEQLGVPCGQFDKDMKKVLGSLSQSEAVAFASIWHKANSGGLNAPMKGTGGKRMVSWIFGRVGY